VLLLVAVIPSCSQRAGEPRPGAGDLNRLLPSPSELRSANFIPVSNQHYGFEFSQVLPLQNVSASNAVGKFDPAIGGALGEVALAIYDFHCPDFTGPSNVTCDWTFAPEECYVAVADHEADRWQWASCEDGVPAICEAADMLSDDGHCYVAVAALGVFSYTLGALFIGEDSASTNLPPIAHITYVSRGGVRRDCAAPGEELRFSCVSSCDDGFVEEYDIDWGDDSPNTFLLPDQIDQIDHSWSTPGDYTVTVTATDDEGLEDTATVGVRILGDFFDEVEPNNDAAGAQAISHLNNLHFAGEFTADGNAEDWYKVTLPADMYIRAKLTTVDCVSLDCHPQIELCEADGDLIEGHYEQVMEFCTAGTYCIRTYD
jgi:hypothetical protein